MDKATFEKEMPALLQQVDEKTQAIWGIMTSQHMIEHLIVTWKISRGRIATPLISEKNLDKKRAFLMSDAPYERNIEIPALQGKLQKLRFPDLETAKSVLLDELSLFHLYYNENPNATPTNPIFGDLNKDEWLQLHFKHSRHHLTQFGILQV
jgi:hypothetical protein